MCYVCDDISMFYGMWWWWLLCYDMGWYFNVLWFVIMVIIVCYDIWWFLCFMVCDDGDYSVMIYDDGNCSVLICDDILVFYGVLWWWLYCVMICEDNYYCSMLWYVMNDDVIIVLCDDGNYSVMVYDDFSVLWYVIMVIIVYSI